MKRIFFILLFVGLVSIAHAADIALVHNHPNRYVVKKGDTLWDLSGKFLRNPWEWKKLWRNNPHIQNPDLIYPGDVLTLKTMKNGEPSLISSRSKHVGRHREAASTDTSSERIVKLSPRVRSTRLKEAIPTISYSAIKPFLNQSDVVAKNELSSAPYILSLESQSIVAIPGDKIYVRNLKNTQDRFFKILREGEPYVDPETKQNLGYATTFVGKAVLERPGNPAILKVTRVTQEIFPKDRLLPFKKRPEKPRFSLQIPKEKVTGFIIDGLDGTSYFGKNNVVVINKGILDGLVAGDVLAIQRNKAIEKDTVKDQARPSRSRSHKKYRPKTQHKPQQLTQLISHKIGELMVFRAFDRVSFALILESSEIIKKDDMVTNP